MASKSIVSELRQTELAIELVRLGARLQVLEAETTLSRERLLRLYKEVKGASPPKGMLPFSADWFVTWEPNIHASLFMEIHQFLTANTRARGIDVTVRAYKLYLEHMGLDSIEPLLTFTRAWTLLRFFDSKLLALETCRRCDGHFVVNPLDLHGDFACGLCAPPSRAGKKRKVVALAHLQGIVIPVPQAQTVIRGISAGPHAVAKRPPGIEKEKRK
jgi:flagellar transcriptional activator FlhC